MLIYSLFFLTAAFAILSLVNVASVVMRLLPQNS
jgi:hypothetical protein